MWRSRHASPFPAMRAAAASSPRPWFGYGRCEVALRNCHVTMPLKMGALGRGCGEKVCRGGRHRRCACDRGAAHAADIIMATKAPPPQPACRFMTGPAGMWAAISAMPGAPRIGRPQPGRPSPPDRSTFISRLTASRRRQLLWRLQAGYDYMLPNRFVIGGVADASFPSFPIFAGISIGGTSLLASPRSARKATARQCSPSAPCAAASATRRAIGSFMPPAASPGPTTN